MPRVNAAPEPTDIYHYGFTFEVKEHVGSVVLEHLSDKFDVHVLDIDILWYLALAASVAKSSKVSYLEVLVQDHDCFIEFFLMDIVSMVQHWKVVPSTHNIGDDTRQE